MQQVESHLCNLIPVPTAAGIVLTRIYGGLTNCTCDTEKIEYRGSQIAHSILRRVDRFSEDVMIFKLYMRQTLL
jgi:hypothetical protein